MLAGSVVVGLEVVPEVVEVLPEVAAEVLPEGVEARGVEEDSVVGVGASREEAAAEEVLEGEAFDVRQADSAMPRTGLLRRLGKWELLQEPCFIDILVHPKICCFPTRGCRIYPAIKPTSKLLNYLPSENQWRLDRSCTP